MSDAFALMNVIGLFAFAIVGSLILSAITM
jgi:hypothetical protein